MTYRHVQWGKIWILVLPLFLAVAVSTSMAGVLGVTIATAGFTTALFAMIVYFQRIEVAIENGEISAAFGLGWPSRTYRWVEVSEVSVVRTPWWYGFGIRKIPGGWMYNVWGLDGAELQLEDGKSFRIGTDDAEGLYAAVQLSLPRR